MNKTITTLIIISFIAMALSGISCKKNYGDEKGQILCPVLGNPVDKKIYADYKGKRIYFCCEGCIQEFNKDPEKYMKKLEGVKLDDAGGPMIGSGDKGKDAGKMDMKGHEGHMH